MTMKKLLKIIGLSVLSLSLFLFFVGVLGTFGFIGKHRGPGEVTPVARPAESVEAVSAKTMAASKQIAAASNQVAPILDKQILFGDFHVHTTFSPDAMAASLPLVEGEGAHPPADACDYARFCSALDFWSINDHAEGITPEHWKETKESIRQCNAVAGSGTPDTVAFLGYEWSQMNQFEKDKHYGHKNVVYKDIEEDKVPPRAIAAISPVVEALQKSTKVLINRIGLSAGAAFMGEDLRDFNKYNGELNSMAPCDPNAHTNDLPDNCLEGVHTPAELFRKLDEGGYESIVIPHGNTWGLYTPPLASWDKQLVGDMQNEKYQFMVEVFSGHGNSEEYREWRAYDVDADGNKTCPEETAEYLPVCRQAGRIVKQNCLAANIDEAECSYREGIAQEHVMSGDYLEGSVVGAGQEEWLDADQCRDCWAGSFSHRPMVSSQYALAIGNFDEDPENPKRFRFGFMASSDNHTARPGTGYKEIDRRENTEARGQKTDHLDRFRAFGTEPATSTEQLNFKNGEVAPSAIQHAERAMSFFMTGGLVAVHSADKSRDSIWEGLQKKEIYGTSGDRMLLWFDLLNADESGKRAPMGSEVSMHQNPKFVVKAVGAFKQKPGCPDYVTQAMTPDRLDHLCRGECFNPSDERKLITRIEVIRIKPQMTPGENVNNLIEDVWLSHQCEVNADGCVFEFEDKDFSSTSRETVYYVRAIQEESDMINKNPLNTQFDENGMAVSVSPCYGDSYKTPYDDDCTAKAEERAWSSPIFIDYQSL